jgi:hypothetical protein
LKESNLQPTSEERPQDASVVADHPERGQTSQYKGLSVLIRQTNR